MFDGEAGERLIDGEQVVAGRIHREFGIEQLMALPAATSLRGLLAAGVLDHDPSHGFGRRGEEVAAAVPVLDLLNVYQPQIGFMHERRCLQSLARLLLSESQRC